MPVAGLQDGFDGGFAHTFDGSQPETDGLAIARRSEEDPAFIHIRPEDFDFKFPRFGASLPLRLPRKKIVE